MKKEFNKLVKGGIKKSGISLRGLARDCGLDVSFLSKMLNGKRNPPSSEKNIKKIAKILELDLDRLIFASGRIPDRYQAVFNDPEFIRKVSAMADEETTPSSAGARKDVSTSARIKPEIEDELL